MRAPAPRVRRAAHIIAPPRDLRHTPRALAPSARPPAPAPVAPPHKPLLPSDILFHLVTSTCFTHVTWYLRERFAPMLIYKLFTSRICYDFFENLVVAPPDACFAFARNQSLTDTIALCYYGLAKSTFKYSDITADPRRDICSPFTTRLLLITHLEILEKSFKFIVQT